MDPKCWKKTGPVFSTAKDAYGPGHASFTKSPDKTEDWIVYHARLKPGGGFNDRSVRIQKFVVKDGDTPVRAHVPIRESSS
jgi:GH43 family beta-xylosidase